METWVKQNGGVVTLDAKECTVCVCPRSLFSLVCELSLCPSLPPSLSLSLYPQDLVSVVCLKVSEYVFHNSSVSSGLIVVVLTT
jgi:hypothetical protein